jgi:hypothetical protein
MSPKMIILSRAHRSDAISPYERGKKKANRVHGDDVYSTPHEDLIHDVNNIAVEARCIWITDFQDLGEDC